MVNVLVLNRFTLATTDYAGWLGAGADVWLITAERSLSGDPVVRRQQLAPYRDVVALADYDENPLVEQQVMTMHRAHRFDLVVAMSEFDLLRAARLREVLGIPGQNVAGAMAFRDKVLMKQLLAAHEVPVADFAPVDRAADLLAFIDLAGYPVIVKPRRGASSVGVRRLAGDHDLADYLAAEPALRGDDGANLIVECYVENQMYHVDGLVVGGRTVLSWPAITTSCLGFTEGETLTSALLDPDDPRCEPTRRLVGDALRALPTPDMAIFHAEVFDSPDHGLLLNEIACRIGGGRIKATLRAGFGVDITELYLRNLVHGDADLAVPPAPTRMAGHVLFPVLPGTLVRAETDCPVPGVEQFVLAKRVGARLTGPANSVDSLADAVVTGVSRAAVAATMDEVAKWYADTVVIDAGR
jgi:biotin carboxylase